MKPKPKPKAKKISTPDGAEDLTDAQQIVLDAEQILDDLDESDNIGLVLELCSFGPVMDFIEADCRFHPGAHARLVTSMQCFEGMQ